ncbi:MAG: FAD-binding oxidoreductase [Thermoleophilaceae bacterium]
MATRELQAPRTPDEAAALVRQCGADGLTLRVRGNGTKYGWGTPAAEPDVELSTSSLGELLEHKEGDLTTIVEPGLELEEAQKRYAKAGQMLALDPPLGGATVGGVLATGDSGPLRHRYGAPRDLVLGMTVALSDGTVAKSGGQVIKNVAGYDIGKLFCGSFGTLGLILRVALRLHPLPARTATAIGRTDDPEILARAASELAHFSLEKDCLDVRWEDGSGAVLTRLGGATAHEQAQAACALLAEQGVQAEIVEDDAELWQRQRDGQRSADRAVMRVSGQQAELARTLRAVETLGGRLVGRGSLGLSWITLDLDRVLELRAALTPFKCVLLDAPRELRASLDVWDAEPVELSRRIKQRFDPAGVFAPGTFAGGI